MSNDPGDYIGMLALDEEQAAFTEEAIRDEAAAAGMPVAVWRETGTQAAPIMVCAQFGVTTRPVAPQAALTGKEGVVAALAMAATEVGIPAEILVSFGIVESGLSVQAKANRGSAHGLLQITDATWNSVYGSKAAAHGCIAMPAARQDLRCQAIIGAETLAETIQAIGRKFGRVPSLAETYCGHFLGWPAAIAILSNPQQGTRDTLRAFYGPKKQTAAFADEIIARNGPLFPRGGAESGAELVEGLATRLAPALAEARRLLAGVAAGQPSATGAGTPATQIFSPRSSATPWFDVARDEERAGVAEVAPNVNSPRIISYFTWTRPVVDPNRDAWCGAFLAFCLGQGHAITQGHGFARAADWLDWGVPLDRPELHCVVVLHPQAPNTSGHVGFLSDFDADFVHLLGGNQGNRVKVKRYPRSAVRDRGFRWPPGFPRPG